jgi:hypothetical protein
MLMPIVKVPDRMVMPESLLLHAQIDTPNMAATIIKTTFDFLFIFALLNLIESQYEPA